ncbi:hypothetical protein BLNAU_16404 [Blattamonas nauphoetae]|uniref:B30.2/SPRY domain-containing protein n=1 Tax=Blattamonas nauphoetae TaxID=2049346 RepID=A0ABQ9XBM9_9EUKA|nr:hypothetical protein BLNAU_16404 [Blattamonas nauphoetae]
MMVEAEEVRSMKQSLADFEQRSSEMTRQMKELQGRIAVAEAEKRMLQREKEKLSNELVKSDREKNELFEKMELMRMMLRTEWNGTASLHTVDGTAHSLTPTTLTQIVQLETKCWRTAFTFPIDEGEWEFKISRSEQTGLNVMLGFLKHPLPEDATLRQCGAYFSGIGGDFLLYNGGMWKGGEFKSEGTNKKWERVGQTAAIRVNMSTREARLFVDDSEQPGIFPDIPSPLCLGITTHDQNKPIPVLWLKRQRS